MWCWFRKAQSENPSPRQRKLPMVKAGQTPLMHLPRAVSS